MKRIFIGQTFNGADCTQSGFIFEISRARAGHYRVVATYQTRWSGNISGAEYTYRMYYEDLAEARRDAKEFLENYTIDFQHEIYESWRKTKPGFKVF